MSHEGASELYDYRWKDKENQAKTVRFACLGADGGFVCQFDDGSGKVGAGVDDRVRKEFAKRDCLMLALHPDIEGYFVSVVKDVGFISCGLSQESRNFLAGIHPEDVKGVWIGARDEIIVQCKSSPAPPKPTPRSTGTTQTRKPGKAEAATQTTGDEPRRTTRKIEFILGPKEQFCNRLVGSQVVGNFAKLEFQGRNVGFFAKRTAAPNILSSLRWSHNLAFHGTKKDHVLSILESGLKPSGSTLPNGTKVVPPKNHFRLGTEYGGVENWAGAVFVSPNVTYAAHIAYADRIADWDSVDHCVIVVVMVAKASYKRYSSTVGTYAPMQGEEATPEYRVTYDVATENVAPHESKSGELMRVESEKAVIVAGVLLLPKSFLDEPPRGMNKESFYRLLQQ